MVKYCPICQKININGSLRYPKSVCNSCLRTNKIFNKDGLEIMFRNVDFQGGFQSYIKDNNNNIIVGYDGILPDLFREGQGIVVEGILDKDNILDAEKVFAKHDENYMPASIQKQLQKNQYWKKNYK